MEINDPSNDSSDVWFVTQGHLAKEPMTGEVQVGDTLFEQSVPATVHVAGDPHPNAPSYALFGTRMGADPLPTGSTIVQTLDSSGQVGANQNLATHDVTAAHHFPETNQTVASVFWDFMNSSGLVYVNGNYVNGPLFESPVYAVGLPLTEAYWLHVKVDGQDRWVLAQCFERRCLTYNPANPEGWEVEAGNVGQHYYEWRYGGEPYYASLHSLLMDFSDSSGRVADLLEDPTLDEGWLVAMEQEMEFWQSLHPRLTTFEPPPDARDLHDELLEQFNLLAAEALILLDALHDDG